MKFLNRWIQGLVLAVALCSSAFAQTPAVNQNQANLPAYLRPFYGDLAFPVTLTNDVYWAAQPPAVQALRTIDPASGDRGALAVTLAQKGYAIDVPIMVWAWDPLNTMIQRKLENFTWVPSGLQPNIAYLLPGSTANPPFVPYDPTSPPAGSVKVSVSADDYPPFVKPTPPPAQATNIVGTKAFANMYLPGPGAMKDSRTPNVFDEQKITQNGATYTAHVSQGLMGLQVYFTLP